MGIRHRCLMIGAGGMAGRWIRDFWAPFRDRQRIEFVGLVDVNPAALGEAGDWLGLPEHGRFGDAREAFAAVEADFCCIVTPP
ncbi:MAG: Gfo/Idh/MocA family oxidoreductase, partial [Chloroflexota bacterium]|nr:Gfo/Idh/MocA family oxidoreductase [Chloroflexota bacterium]